jgi:putative FmdB family regulatory protein
MYEYRCGSCDKQFEIAQSIHAVPEETTCPHCKAKKATRLMSAFASKIVGDHKPGFSEMKAYNMLNERMHKLGKLPPMMGKRSNPEPRVSSSSDSGSTSESS